MNHSFSHPTGAEYGAEASRAVWRVTLDYLLFPSEAGDAVAFLDPVAAHLESWDQKKSGGFIKGVQTMRDIGREYIEEWCTRVRRNSRNDGWKSRRSGSGFEERDQATLFANQEDNLHEYFEYFLSNTINGP